jgi:hypothetical protein
MKRFVQIASFAAAGMLVAGAAHAATVSISTGSGGQLNAGSGVASNIAPLATEVSVGFNLRRNVTLDASFLFAHDVVSPDGTAKAAYVGFRPGIKAYGGLPWSNFRPYARIAVPVQYNAETKTAELGLLVGGGLEYRLGGTVGVFGEALVTPFFTNGIVPIEGRVGVALHF